MLDYMVGIGVGIWYMICFNLYVLTDNERWYQSLTFTTLAATIPFFVVLTVLP